MATLYVENVPADLYSALRKRARQNRSSIAGEVIAIVKNAVPTAAELKRRQKVFQRMLELQSRSPLTPGPFPSTEEMIREDRGR